MTPPPRLVEDTVGAFVGPVGTLVPGAEGGPLEGTTLAVKDLFDVVGTVTGAGNPTFASGRSPATANAPAVQRLVDAGATVVGKTITDELAFSLSGTNVHYGTPRNVAAPDRIPGGSSAGSAAAVAAGIVDLALGTDTGGSIRVPASYCGICGWRSTHGATPVDGVVPLSPSFDTVGLFAQRLDLLLRGAEALVDDAAGGDERPVRRLAFVHEAIDDVTPDIAQAVRDAVAALGASTVTLGVDLGEALTAFRTRQQWEAWQAHGEWIRTMRPEMGPNIAARFAAGASVTEDAVRRADVVRSAVRRMVLDATTDGTVLVLPAAAGAAPPLPQPGVAPLDDRAADAHELRRVRTMRLTCIAGLAGAPVVVLPLAQAEGCPLGVAFIGAPGTDLDLLRWAVQTFPGLAPTQEDE